MDNEEKQIIDGFIKWAKNITKGSILFEGTIKSVDETKFTCVVTVTGNSVSTDILNVPLKVLIGSQASVIEIPTIGSDCTVCYRDNNIQRPQLVNVDKSDKLLIKIGNDSDGYQTLQVTKDGFVFNGGNNGGLVILQKAIDNFNSIKTYTDTLKTAIEAGFTAVGVGSAASGPNGKTAFDAAMTASISFEDMNNDKIKM
jgi:hypothetical protein